MRRFFWLPTGVLLLLSVAIAQAQVDKGDNYTQTGDPKTPLTGEEYLAALNARSKQAFLVWKQAEALLRKKETAKAIPLLQKSLEIQPEDSTVRVVLADVYAQQHRTEEVLQVLKPALDNVSGEVTTPMKYVLALLDTRKWEEAVALYEKSVRNPIYWGYQSIDAKGTFQSHTLPAVHFSPDVYDEPDLRAQAHLIIGSQRSGWGLAGLDQQTEMLYNLDQLRQALKYNRNSLDAQVLSAIVLGELERYAEAKVAFTVATKNAPREARPEIQATLAHYTLLEETQKNYEAQQAKRQAEQKAQAQGNEAGQ